MKTKKLVILLATLGSLTISSIVPGLISSNASTDQFIQSDNGIGTKDTIHSILSDKDGNLWVGTNMSKLYERASGQINFVDVPVEFESSNVTLKHMIQDKAGNIWISTSNGLYIKHFGNEKTFTKYTTGLESSTGEFDDILQDKSGNIWLADLKEANKIYKMKDIKLGFDAIKTGAAKGASSIAQDKNGNIYFVDDNSELWMAKANTDTFSKFLNGETPLPADIWKVYADNENNIWLGGGQGLYEKSTSTNVFKLTSLKYPIGNNGYGGEMFHEDSKKNLWIVTDGNGLFEKTGNNVFTQFTAGIPENLGMRCVEGDASGHLWIGSDNNGAYVSNFQILPNSDNSLSTGAIIGIVIGSIAGVALIAGVAYFYMNKSKVNKTEASKK